MSQQMFLVQVVDVNALAVNASQTFPLTLSVIPNIVIPDRNTSISVESCSQTTLVVKNYGPSVDSCRILIMHNPQAGCIGNPTFIGKGGASSYFSALNLSNTQFLQNGLYVPFTFSNMGATLQTTLSLPVNSIVTASYVVVTTPFSGGAAPTCALSVGGTSVQATSDNDLTIDNQYLKTQIVPVFGGGKLSVTLGGTALAGAGYALVTAIIAGS